LQNAKVTVHTICHGGKTLPQNNVATMQSSNRWWWQTNQVNQIECFFNTTIVKLPLYNWTIHLRLQYNASTIRLRSSMTHQLDVRQLLCATVGDRTFAIAGLWNSLPPDIIACDTVQRFRRELKTFLLRQSYPSIVF